MASGGKVERINIAEKFARFSEQRQPKIVAELSGQEVKLVKVQGTFAWHRHDDLVEEIFLVLARPLSRRVPGQDCRAGAGCYATARDAMFRDYRVAFLSDATATYDYPDRGFGFGSMPNADVHHATLVILAASTAHVMPVADLAGRVARVRNR
jgi:hypothetical protein